jgi:hypothetical protein
MKSDMRGLATGRVEFLAPATERGLVANHNTHMSSGDFGTRER